MDFQIAASDDHASVSLSGQFTFTDAAKFRQLVDTLLAGSHAAISLDFANVTFIDSAGMGMLLLLRDECQSQKVPITIKAAQGQVEKVFFISKFDQLFSMPT